ncbi:hypothetical protein BWQ96_03521 [Gracilariopsis chorda]|uniref:Uncharacterized protein n=1 Tax=Gracilariopsis chorda TaxID=448386 RepID=A0A2V3IXA0_9FLOR|nr:hypothetical protein BWQ96_03521 [Gracilariopsis chorda]|eukprot:PXF46695.1 hypothetical protein BWQ96_03521 [Gracilariopsis chorda]
MAKLRHENRKKANSSGGGETNGVHEKLAQDIVIKIENFNAEKEAANMELQGKKDAFLAGESNVREMAL